MRYPYVDHRDFQLGAADGYARAHSGTIGERTGRGSMALNLLSGKPFVEWRSHRSEFVLSSMPAILCSVKPLSAQLADLSVRAKKVEDDVAAAQKEAHYKIMARRTTGLCGRGRVYLVGLVAA